MVESEADAFSDPTTHEDGRPRAAVVRLTVLLADDDEDGLEVVGETLERRGLRVLKAASGCDALSVALAAQPDVILLDLGLGDIHGLDVARLLKTEATTRHIPVVVYTAYPHLEPEAKAIGCSAFVSKPTTSDELVQALVGAATRA